MASFGEDENIDVYRFREIARSLFNGLNYSDGQILNRIEEIRQELYDCNMFATEIEVSLGLNEPFTPLSFERIINKVKELVGAKNNANNSPRQVLYAPALEDPKYRVEGLEEMTAKIKELMIKNSVQGNTESGFYRLKDDVQQAFLFRDQVMAALGNPDDAIAQIKELAEIKAEIDSGNIGVLSNLSYTLEQQNLEMFWSKIQVLFGNTEIDFESAYNRIVDLLHNPEQFTGDKDREIEQLKSEYHQKLDEHHQEISSLVDRLRIANKVIARLVDE